MPWSPAGRLTPLTRGQLVEHQVSAEAPSPSPSGFGFLRSRIAPYTSAYLIYRTQLEFHTGSSPAAGVVP
ncbi:hypothetical protein Q8A67_021586 [Cirrhinus molitorella]|uniref:Uncharacterized protein n=1 Tax=Cirrhinus molitorella TaxID=172907 RepID=A0AA88P775_9TELE|nr:hypothetical protein Q8A67_021586 [Cirrhinus molitorella]